MARDRDHRAEFGRPAYGSFRELIADQARTIRRAGAMRKDAKQGLVSKAFRSRLMLAHTYVNECRYCSWFHARGALKEGIPAEQVEELLCGAVEDSPVEERPALLYAIHFADTDGHPDGEARARMVEIYGEERADAIDRALLTIRGGNLIGNSLDYFLFRLSGGRLGRKGHVPMGEPELACDPALTD